MKLGNVKTSDIRNALRVVEAALGSTSVEACIYRRELARRELGPQAESTMDRRCATCRFWYDNRTKHEPQCDGFCQRYPAIVQKGPDEWCGEWQAAEKEPLMDERSP